MPVLLDILPRFKGKRVVVLGDLILDEYITGRPSRISREAPVVVLEYMRRSTLPGGGTAPACNIQSLGGAATQVGVIGRDISGEELREALENRGVNVSGLVVDPSRPTITKTRIVALGPQHIPQQIARIDKLERTPISGQVEQDVIAALERVLPGSDALLISDYRSGTICATVVDAARQISSAHNIPITVDAQGDFAKFHHATLFRCNDREAEQALHRDLVTDEDFERGLRELRDQLDARGVVVTRGGEGMSVLDFDGQYHHVLASDAVEVFDVTGAGDTVIAVLTLALCAGATLLDAAQLANFGAGIVVQKLGNATLQPGELEHAIEVAGYE